MIRRAHRTRIGRCAMARGGLTRAHLTSHEHLWLALAVVHAPPHRGHFASRVHPIRRSLMAQNSPNGRPPTPRKLLVFRHALGYDSSEWPNAAIRPRTSYRPNRTEHAIARRKRYPFAGKRVTAFIGPILPLQSRTATRQQRSCSASACFDTEVRWVFARQRSGSSRGGPKGFAGTPPIPRGTIARSTRIPGRSAPCRAPRQRPS
jgi:hypothetical protein